MNDTMVAGLASVSANVPAARPSRPRASRAGAAVWATGACQVRQASTSSSAPPPSASGVLAWVSPSMSQRTLKAPTAPYTASAAAAPRPVASPAARPRSRVRCMVNKPMGPTGAAMSTPMTAACRNTVIEVKSMHQC
ncbi:hypothetical protein D3C72_1778060 [compost metagenome]